ncbi:MAG: LegC family aminotransferase [Clostridium sp.]|nr:LegC family aminotransferase [Clostridium sp.]
MKFIPLSIPNFEGNERKYVDDAVSQGWVSTGGAYITRLEETLAEYVGTKTAVACQSGTAGIHLALIESGVQPGDMVIVPTLTFIAAVNPVRYQFADPVFMDCDESLCMDPMKLKTFCEEECMWDGNALIHKADKKCIKAIVVVHVFGNMADMEAIMEIAEKYRLRVVEDATEALGSCYTEGKYAGKYAGTIGDFGVYSFNGNKIITTGGGGAVVGKNQAELEHIRYISTQAKTDPVFYVHDEVGYNYRMTNVQAALGVAQMELLGEFVKRKQANYALYAELLREYNKGRLMKFRSGTSANHWFYALELRLDELGITIREVIERLHKENIQTRAIWGLIHKQKPYRDTVAYKIENAEKYSRCVLNIPCSTQITQQEIEYVAKSIMDM